MNTPENSHAPQPDSAVPLESPSPRCPSWIRRFLLFLLLLLACAGGYAGYDAWRFLNTPGEASSPRDIILEIAPGATFDRVAWDLYKAKAITNVPRFRLLAQYYRKLGAIQAGEFQINTGWTPEQVLQQLVYGKPMLYRLALREGLAWWEVARLVEEGGFAKADEFAKVIHDPEFLRAYGIPFSNAEGFLFPETYLLRKPKKLDGRAQAEVVAKILVESFWKRSWPLWTQYAANTTERNTELVTIPALTLRNGGITAMRQNQRASIVAGVHNATAPANGTTPAGNGTTTVMQEVQAPLQVPVSADILRRLVILASLVEKETGAPEERARVAGVYTNRIRINMLLQCDPTILYGLGEKYSGPIRRSHLADASNPYNTYQRPGLPPGPIASPGLESLRAAVAPEAHSFLYFVAIGDGGKHEFTSNLNDHNKAVERYRAFERSRATQK